MGLLSRFLRRKVSPSRQRSLLDSTGPANAPGNRRIIKTARTVESINEGARAGFRPLVRSALPNPEIHYCVAVFQNPETGEIKLSGDARYPPEGERVFGYETYYPYHFPNPFAAYLVPKDLAVDEEVWLEDLIDDIVAEYGNQDDNPRLAAAPAIWDGKDFEILLDPHRDIDRCIG